jgi:tetratricopeptide (TPR) repeat protein
MDLIRPDVGFPEQPPSEHCPRNGKISEAYATSLNNLALLYDNQGQYAKVEPLYQRALAIREKALGPEHPDVATSLNHLAWLYHNQGQYAKAEPLYERTLAICEKAFGEDHPNVGVTNVRL